MTHELPIPEVSRYIKLIDWRETGFDIKKAYVCALFSELTYYRIPDFETKDADRVNVIPCLAYQQAVREGRSLDFDQIMRSLDFDQVFVVIRRYAIVVGVRTPNMIIIAIRGTQYLYDWFVNLRAYKHIIRGLHHLKDFSEVGFHSGFFRAIYPCFEPISNEIDKFKLSHNDDIPIYVTGHSLGGALAAILQVLWRAHPLKPGIYAGAITRSDKIFAGYTFGMPRYGDMMAVSQCATPYHLYNELDIVPNVPPKWLGFENCFSEFRLDGTSLENSQRRESVKFASWLMQLVTGKAVANHAMELYRKRTREAF